MKTKITCTLLCSLLSAVPFASMAHQAGDWLMRGGVINVSPDEDSGKVSVETLGKTDMEVRVDDDTQLGLNFAYMLSDNIAIELLAATPFTHDIKLKKSQLDLGDGKLAEVSHLPPTLSAVYFFGDQNSKFRPYLGAGINYTFFFDEEFSGQRKSQGFNDLELDSSWGWAAQIGFDYELNDKWFINAQARYIDISTDADFKVGELKSKVSVDIDPYVYMIGLGYRF